MTGGGLLKACPASSCHAMTRKRHPWAAKVKDGQDVKGSKHADIAQCVSARGTQRMIAQHTLHESAAPSCCPDAAVRQHWLLQHTTTYASNLAPPVRPSRAHIGDVCSPAARTASHPAHCAAQRWRGRARRARLTRPRRSAQTTGAAARRAWRAARRCRAARCRTGTGRSLNRARSWARRRRS